MLPVVIFCQKSSPNTVHGAGSLPFVMHFTIWRNFCNTRKCFYILELLNCQNSWKILIAFKSQGRRKPGKKIFWIAELTKLGAEVQFPGPKIYSGSSVVLVTLKQILEPSTGDLHLPPNLL